MPINPEIALSVRPTQVPDPIQSYGNALAIKSHIQQQQIQQQQMQENELQIQKNRQAIQDQQTARQTLAKYNGDFDKALPELAGQVAPDFYTGLVQHNLNTKKTLSEIADKDLTVTKDKNSRFLALVDQAAGMDPERYKQMYPTIRAQAITIHPEMAAQIPTDPIPQDHLSDLKLSIQSSEQALAAEASRREKTAAVDTHNARVAELPGLEAKSEGAVVANAAGDLATAPTYGDYQNRLAKLPPPVRAKFPDYSTQDRATPIADEHVTAIRQPGLTPEQQQTAQNTKEYRDSTIDLRQQMLDMRKDQTARENKQTQNSAAVDRRLAEKEYSAAQIAESKLNTLRRSLGTAIASGGKSYVDRFGNLKSVNGADNATDLLKENKDRYEQITSDLKTALENKYNASARLGGTPQVSLEDAIAALDDADAAAAAGKPAPTKTPQAKPQGSKQGKAAPVTEDQIRREAERRGFPPNGPEADAAIKAARAGGRLQ